MDEKKTDGKTELMQSISAELETMKKRIMDIEIILTAMEETEPGRLSGLLSLKNPL